MIPFLKTNLGSKRTIFNTILCFILICTFSIVFMSTIQKYIALNETLNKNDSLVIGITNNPNLKNDIYKYFDYKVNIYKEKVGKDFLKPLNAIVIQEISSKTYSKTSYINEDTIVKGKYDRLKENEIAISNNLHRYLDLNVGDVVYLENIKGKMIDCSIKYIYEDVYSFYKIDANVNAKSVLLNAYLDGLSNQEQDYIHFYRNNSFTYSDIYYKSKTQNFVIFNISIYLTFYLLLSAITILVSYFIITNPIKLKMKRLFQYGARYNIYFWGLLLISIILLPVTACNILLYYILDCLNLFYLPIIKIPILIFIYTMQFYSIVRR